MRRNVVLPEPLCPIRTTASLGRMTRLNGDSAGRSPYSFVRPDAQSSAPLGRFGAGGSFFAAGSVAFAAALAGFGGWLGRAEAPVGFGCVRLIVSILAWRPAVPWRPADLLPGIASTRRCAGSRNRNHAAVIPATSMAPMAAWMAAGTGALPVVAARRAATTGSEPMRATMIGHAVRSASFMPATSGGRSWPSLYGSGAPIVVDTSAPAAPHHAAGSASTAASSTDRIVRFTATAASAPTRATPAATTAGTTAWRSSSSPLSTGSESVRSDWSISWEIGSMASRPAR